MAIRGFYSKRGERKNRYKREKRVRVLGRSESALRLGVCFSLARLYL